MESIIRDHLSSLLGTSAAFFMCLTAMARYLIGENAKLKARLQEKDRKFQDQAIGDLKAITNIMGADMRSLKNEISELSRVVSEILGRLEIRKSDRKI